MTIIKVVDFETNGLAADADPWEFGWQDVVLDGSGSWGLGRRDGCLLYSEQPADPEAQAVHHITEQAVRNEGLPLDRQWRKAHNWGADFADIAAYAAHNAEMERKYLPTEMTGEAPWICTMKCAMRVWPDCPKFSNQVLRYWLKLPIPGSLLELANSSHQALSDAYITGEILLALLGREGLDTLIGWTREPKLYPRLTFGKHKGLRWRDVPRDYLDWIIFKARDDGSQRDWPDIVHCAKLAYRGEL